jgi:hypothetical protein
MATYRNLIMFQSGYFYSKMAAYLILLSQENYFQDGGLPDHVSVRLFLFQDGGPPDNVAVP